METKINIENIVDLEKLKLDTNLNVDITINSIQNKYDLLFDSITFDNLNTLVHNIIFKNKIQDLYIKKIQVFKHNEKIKFEKNLNNTTKLLSEFSFILLLEGNELKIKTNNGAQNLQIGDLFIFKTLDFLIDDSTIEDRIILLGSYAFNLFNQNNVKKVII